MPNVLREKKHMCLPDNMYCTIRETTFSRNFFQPLVSETKWPDYISYIYSYILDSLAKKMTISPKFWLIGYIHIGFPYLRERIATSGHLLHFHRNITTHCGQCMAKASYRSNLALSTHFEKFPKR